MSKRPSTSRDTAAIEQRKAALLALLLKDQEEALASMQAAAETARAAAAHPEMRPENDKDTRALEAGYLASGQSARAAALRRSVAELRALRVRACAPGEPVGLLALVQVRDQDDEVARYFIAPAGGGKRLAVAGDGEGASVLVLTPGSPLGDALLDKVRGDVIELVLAGKARQLEIIAVA